MDMGHNSESDKPASAVSDRLPIEIAKFWKSLRNRREHWRIGISEWQGHTLINIRVWQTGSDGIDRPTKHGIALGIRKLPELTNALLKAESRAREIGLLEEGER